MADKIRLEKDYGAVYEPTDSEDDYSEDEKELLREVRKGREDPNRGTKRELMAFADSDDGQTEDDDDDDEGEEDDDVMHDSDIEGAGDGGDDDMPDSMDWGSKRGNYYSTDFVDPDFDSYTAEQAELAKQEEEEALAIQKRLAKHMREEDFMLDESLSKADDKVEKSETTALDTTKIKADFSGLTQREKKQLFQKDSPEFEALVNDFKLLMEDVEKLHTPVLKYVAAHNVPMIPALEFTQIYRNLALTYCSNIGFYLLLKAKRINVRNHPLAKRLAQLKKLLFQLQDKYDNIIKPQLEALLERIVDGDEFEVLPIEPSTVKKAKKSKLSILDKYGESTEKAAAAAAAMDDEHIDAVNAQEDMLASSDEDEAENEEDAEDDAELDDDEDARRGITYEIAKNKGLTPHRKKEARNPRVKHRSKFRKALIRRKGAVRTVRKETKRYGGEISGIKSTVVKSVKFKT